MIPFFLPQFLGGSLKQVWNNILCYVLALNPVCPIYITVSLVLEELTDRHICKEKQKQKPTLFLTNQCWSPRYKVPVLSTCGGCHPEWFFVASFYSFKYIANNHDHNNYNNDTNNNKLSSCKTFHLHNFFFPVSVFRFC